MRWMRWDEYCNIWIPIWSVLFRSFFLVVLFKYVCMLPSLLTRTRRGEESTREVWWYIFIVIVDDFGNTHLVLFTFACCCCVPTEMLCWIVDFVIRLEFEMRCRCKYKVACPSSISMCLGQRHWVLRIDSRWWLTCLLAYRTNESQDTCAYACMYE